MHKNILCLILACGILLGGCAQSGSATSPISGSNNGPASSDGISFPIASPLPDRSFTYDPHVWSPRFDEYYKDDRRESFNNLIDALREGKDVFKCKNRRIYEWCTSDVTLGELYPVACMVVTGEDEEEKEPFRAGVGKICYRMPKEDFLDRVKAFEKDVTGIINSTVKPSYSDFEKCFALYEYMESNYTYDYDWPPDTKDGLVYNCFMTHTGICGELASIYTYLLMECGIDAVTVEDSKMSHAWTLVTLDGQPYHVDPTWGLKDAPEDQLYLNYFMMTNADRIRDDFDPNYWTLTLLADPFLTDYDVDILAEDDRYSCFRDSYLVSADYDADTIEYVDGSETHTLNYK